MTIQQLAVILKDEVIKGKGNYPVYFRAGNIGYPMMEAKIIEGDDKIPRLEMTWFVKVE